MNESFEVLTPRTKVDILFSADKVIRDYHWVINSKPPLITDNEINIYRSPSAFAPFRGIGTIKLTVMQSLDKTVIKCDIYPYNNSFPYIIILGIGLMTAWTFGGLLISSYSNNTLSVLGLGWAAAIFFTYISALKNKKRLRDYSAAIVKELTK